MLLCEKDNLKCLSDRLQYRILNLHEKHKISTCYRCPEIIFKNFNDANVFIECYSHDALRFIAFTVSSQRDPTEGGGFYSSG